MTPWLVSRAIIFVTLMVLGARAAHNIPDYSRLVMWDGNWYRIIATSGYGPPPHAGDWSTWPYFPLLPAIGWLGHAIGGKYTLTQLAASNVAALFALAGVRRLALPYGQAAANWAVWLTALFPGAITLAMSYPDSLYLAGTVWAFVLIADARPAWAGVVAVIATASRPNAFVMLVPLALAAFAGVGRTDRPITRSIALVVGPSLVFLAAWCGWLWHATGDPLVFIGSKSAWVEVTILDVIRSPLANRYALLHVALSAVLAAPFLVHWRRYPVAWRVVVGLGVVPSLALGTVGLARYSICCFPLAIAAGDLVTRRLSDRRAWWLLAVSSGLLVWFGLLISYWNYVP